MGCLIYRQYERVGRDGYPPEWHDLHVATRSGNTLGIKDLVREAAGHRCVRCGHPYRKGEHPMEREQTDDGEVLVSWSPCDENCTHVAPRDGIVRIRDPLEVAPVTIVGDDGASYPAGFIRESFSDSVAVEAMWRILTVHHLDKDKANCRWWNLAALCQRCHLSVQSRVNLERIWPWEHTPWFKPYAAGWYAYSYLGEDLDRDETLARLDELLALERVA